MLRSPRGGGPDAPLACVATKPPRFRIVLKTIGRYEVRAEIGRGAMGAVYEGFDSAIGRRVAIKTLRLDLFNAVQLPGVLARFKREAQSAGRLTHPNIVTIYEYGEEAGTPYIAMEFISGQDLGQQLNGGLRFTFDKVEKIMTQLLGALTSAHENGVVHRDLKPSNLFLLQDGSLKVVDFGIAWVESSDLTDSGTMLGTPAYMSPEQCLGTHVDHRSDVYSAGVILYQLLTGEKPFTGSVTSIIQKVLRQNPLPPSDLNPMISGAWDSVVSRAMAKRPESRFASAKEFSDAIKIASLGAVRSTQGNRPAQYEATVPNPTAKVQEPKTFPSARPSQTQSSRPVQMLALLVVVLIGGSVALYFDVIRLPLPTLFVRARSVPAAAGDDINRKRENEAPTREELEMKAAVERAAAEKAAAERAAAERAAAERAAAERAAAERAAAEKAAADRVAADKRKRAATKLAAEKVAAAKLAAERAIAERSAAERAVAERAAADRIAAEKATSQRIAAEVEAALNRAADKAAADKVVAEKAAAVRLAAEKAAADKVAAERAAAEKAAAEMSAAEDASALEIAARKAALAKPKPPTHPELEGHWTGTASDNFGYCPTGSFAIVIKNGDVEGTVEWQSGSPSEGVVRGYVRDDGTVSITIIAQTPDFYDSNFVDLYPTGGRLVGRDRRTCPGGREYVVSLGRG
jgi:serine/threonine protein kinase